MGRGILLWLLGVPITIIILLALFSGWRSNETLSCFRPGAFCVSRPAHARRQRGENRVDIAAGLQAKNRAAIVEGIEFDVAAAPNLLLLTFGVGPRFRPVGAYDVRIDVEKALTNVPGKREIGVPGAVLCIVVAVQIIEKDAADAARLVAML